MEGCVAKNNLSEQCRRLFWTEIEQMGNIIIFDRYYTWGIINDDILEQGILIYPLFQDVNQNVQQYYCP